MKAYLAKANRAARSAHLLSDDGDFNGAASRGYYACFFSARAALAAFDPEPVDAKTHATVIRRFGLLVVSRNDLDRGYGRALRTAYQIREIADYAMADVKQERARKLLDEMDSFVAAVVNSISSKIP